VAEVALAFVLVVSAGLLLRSFVSLSRTDPGFHPDGAITGLIGLPEVRYDTAGAVAFHRRFLDRVRALPGVREAALGSDLPWTGYDENTGFGIVGRQFPRGQGPEGRYHFITPGYIRSLGTPLVLGRDITEADTALAPPVVLVNESTARRYWNMPENAVGARLNLWGKERTVVGVIGDVRDTPSDASSAPAVYFPEAQQWYSQDMFLIVRADGNPGGLVEPIRQALRDLDSALPIANVATLDAVAGAAFATRRFTLWLVGAFGLTALFLALVGIYGVMAQAVDQRQHEFGLRQALGARPADILRLVLSGGIVLALAGLGTGIAIATAATRLLASMLYRVSPADPGTFAAVAIILLSVGMAASYLPARRATRVDPAQALRN
jgi:predicted permease